MRRSLSVTRWSHLFACLWLYGSSVTTVAGQTAAEAELVSPDVGEEKEEKVSQRPEMDRVYAAWRAAMVSRDVSAWDKVTATSRKVATRNLIISQKHPFPESLFTIPIRPPSVLQLRLLDEQVVGNRAQLFYFGKVDMGVGNERVIPDNLLILRFIREKEKWLFDSTQFVNLQGSENERAKLAAGDLSPLSEGDFELPEEDPVVPKLVAIPDYVGHLQVTLRGFRVRLQVNGIDCGTVENANVTNLVIGGFHKGGNDLRVDVERLPLEDESKRFFTINAFVMTGKSDNPRARIFHYQPDDVQAVAERIATQIWANAITIRGKPEAGGSQ